MNFVEKLNHLIEPSLKNKFRNYEKMQNKIILQKYSIVLNEKCNDNNKSSKCNIITFFKLK